MIRYTYNIITVNIYGIGCKGENIHETKKKIEMKFTFAFNPSVCLCMSLWTCVAFIIVEYMNLLPLRLRLLPLLLLLLIHRFLILLRNKRHFREKFTEFHAIYNFSNTLRTVCLLISGRIVKQVAKRKKCSLMNIYLIWCTDWTSPFFAAIQCRLFFSQFYFIRKIHTPNLRGVIDVITSSNRKI